MPHKYNPLLLELIQEVSPKSNFSATSNPGVTDDSSKGYEVGSGWANIITNKAYICLDATTGAAVWTETTSVTTDPPFERTGTIILPKITTDTLKLLNPNNDAFVIGSPTEEGGDIKVYRDSSGNRALSLNTDAASNEEGLYLYAGVICRNFFTFGQETLNTTYPVFVNGISFFYGTLIVSPSYWLTFDQCTTTTNKAEWRFDLNVSSGSASHSIKLKIDGNDIIVAQATGNGAGGVVDLKAIINEQLVYTPSSDTLITAAGGITITKTIMRIAGNGGAIDITANPQIAAGTDGQIVIIQGTHDVNTVTLDDGTGLALSAQCVLSSQDSITLVYDSGDAEWIEIGRTTVI